MNTSVRGIFGFSWISLASILPYSLLAEENQTGSEGYRLNRIVTTASGFDQEVRDAPASISIVTPEDVRDRPIRDLAEALSYVPGVSIDQGVGKTGGYNISIRGMPASYTLILLDGKRQNTTTAGFPNGFEEVITSFMPPFSAIDRIEVIRGPASTIYGSDAVGGIVNIITKKQFDKWGASLTLDATLQEQKLFGNLYGLSLWAAGPLDSLKRWSLSLRLREQYRSPVQPSNFAVIPTTEGNLRNNLVGLSESNSSGLGLRLGYTPNDSNHFYIDLDHGLQWYDNAKSLLGTVGIIGGYRDNLFFSRNNLTLAHEGRYGRVRTDTSAQFISTLNYGRVITVSAVPTGSPLVGADRDILGADVVADHKLIIDVSDNTILTLGGRYWFTSLHDRIIPNDPFLFHHNAALFGENETFLLENLALTLGVRANYNSSFGFNISPRGYLVYNALTNSRLGDLTLKGGISTGYRTPTVTQLVPGISGLTAQGTVPVYGNPALKPESSINYELGLLHETSITDFSITGFFINFRDKIQSAGVSNGQIVPIEGSPVCVSSSNRQCSYPINADEAISYGAEIYFGFKPISLGGLGNISQNLSYTYNKTLQTSGTGIGLPLTGIPLHTLNGGITYSVWNLSFYIRGELRAKQLRTQIQARGGTSAGSLTTLETFRAQNPGLSEFYKPYFLLHLGGSYQINKSFRLSFGIYNLLNHNFVDFVQVTQGSNSFFLNNYNYVREGRRYYVSLSMDF